jgi:hypothetical protein
LLWAPKKEHLKLALGACSITRVEAPFSLEGVSRLCSPEEGRANG